jgi:saccharopine dehydrogenase-like NADP-dependent oxidoreductase
MDMQAALKDGTITDGAFASVVEVMGARGGHLTRLTLSCVSRLQEAIRLVPWAVAAAGVFATVGTVPIEVLLMLCRGEFIERGVLPVTSIKNPMELFERMRGRGHQLAEKSEILN